jgi:hypothetical protein
LFVCDEAEARWCYSQARTQTMEAVVDRQDTLK